MREMNRREDPRMEISLRCHIASPSFGQRGAMRTENLSRSGVLIAWRGEDGPLPLPAVGQILTVEVELPSTHGFGPKCIHCQGTVARVIEPEGDCPRVALRVNYMDFRSFHDRLRAFSSARPIENRWMA
jgi:hypothetical protein